jgi:hypothetical protein
MSCGEPIQRAVDTDEIRIVRHEHLTALRCDVEMEVIRYFGEAKIATICDRMIRPDELDYQCTGSNVLIKVETRHQITAVDRFATRRSSITSLWR